MKLKIFPIANVTETGVETFTSNKTVRFILTNDNNFYIFYDEVTV